jgi:hypothetical protein
VSGITLILSGFSHTIKRRPHGPALRAARGVFLYGETESEVGNELTKLRADLLRGLDINPEKLTLNLYLAAWLKSMELTKSYNTLRKYRLLPYDPLTQ